MNTRTFYNVNPYSTLVISYNTTACTADLEIPRSVYIWLHIRSDDQTFPPLSKGFIHIVQYNILIFIASVLSTD
jgi:hypothetical protein